jgi:hypothetical protein
MKPVKKKVKLPQKGMKIIHLPDDVLIHLYELADLDGRTPKNYLENLVINHVKEVTSNQVA